MSFKWSEEFSCNINEIDKQHKKIFEIGYRLYLLVSADDDYDRYDEIVDIIDELKDYTVYHFNFEEKLMKEYGYENFEMHSMEHKFFIKKIERIERSDIENQQKDAILNIIKFVGDWISSHIMINDKKYKDFFNSKGVY